MVDDQRRGASAGEASDGSGVAVPPACKALPDVRGRPCETVRVQGEGVPVAAAVQGGPLGNRSVWLPSWLPCDFEENLAMLATMNTSS